MAYTPEKPPLAESSEQLRARIPGWGVDRWTWTRRTARRSRNCSTGPT